ncbi:hypothetical protein GRX03_00155 [Halovenus sp. WSH3]|uniref:Uncharacterized protein n=1 Tax=Halovenus carboxidivorans TaxID=2692199 RepID=A0A6B0T418_9EURY|nr:hypothetical protein [Halovenus carboxidivorans]MXR50022.1 hypothetical protein [Halovenus carboxidivorans]
MSTLQADTAADPDRLVEALPPARGAWERTDHEGGIVEYVIAGDDGVCTAAKLVVRPDVIEETAVRLDRKRDCTDVGTDRFDDVAAARETVERELSAVLDGIEA